MEYENKEVYFHQYCGTCKHESVDDIKDPCNECLGYPYNLHSHKPVKWEEKKK